MPLWGYKIKYSVSLMLSWHLLKPSPLLLIQQNIKYTYYRMETPFGPIENLIGKQKCIFGVPQLSAGVFDVLPLSGGQDMYIYIVSQWFAI